MPHRRRLASAFTPRRTSPCLRHRPPSVIDAASRQWLLCPNARNTVGASSGCSRISVSPDCERKATLISSADTGSSGARSPPSVAFAPSPTMPLGVDPPRGSRSSTVRPSVARPARRRGTVPSPPGEAAQSPLSPAPLGPRERVGVREGFRDDAEHDEHQLRHEVITTGRQEPSVRTTLPPARGQRSRARIGGWTRCGGLMPVVQPLGTLPGRGSGGCRVAPASGATRPPGHPVVATGAAWVCRRLGHGSPGRP